jgi:serine/threonine-protein kinase
LDLDTAARELWLQELAREQPDVARILKKMLANHAAVESSRFIEDPLVQRTLPVTREGTRVGAYRLERSIGRGGMGEVWLAQRVDGRYEGVCAIKFLDPSFGSPALRDRFHREGQMLARLAHPNIARLLDAGEADDATPYLALEYVDGQRIDRYCEAKALGVKQRVRLFLDVIAAVAYAHSQLVIHRDLKPSNVLVTAEGQVKLLDFGIAKLLRADGEADPALTRLEESLLTPDYAAPEQIAGEEPSTGTDVYQLGLLLHVVLTGSHPLAGSTSRSDKMRMVLNAQIPRLSSAANAEVARQLRGDLDAIVEVALRRLPGERYATAQALRDDLTRYLDNEPVQARRGARWDRARKFVSRNRLAVTSSIAAVAALCVALGFAYSQALEARAQRDQARLEAKRADAEARFMNLMMSDVGEPGVPVTPERILDRALNWIGEQQGEEPQFVVQMLARISSRFVDIGNVQRGYEALVRAEQVAQASGDALLLAEVNCELVSSEIQLQRVERAAERLAFASDLLARSAMETPSLDCLIARADLAEAQGDLRAASREWEAVLPLLETQGVGTSLAYASALGDLATIYASLGDAKRGYEYIHRARVQREVQGYKDTTGVLTAKHNEAMALWNLGELRTAFELETDVLNRRIERDSIDGLTAGTSLGYGSMLVRLDRAAEALTWIERGAASAQRAGHRSAGVYVEMQRTKALVAMGALDQAEKAIATAQSLAGEDTTLFREPLTRIRLSRAEVLLARREWSEARLLIDLLRKEIDDPDNELAFYRPIALLIASRIALAQERVDEAETFAREALAIYQERARSPSASADVGEVSLELARIALRKGDRASAVSLATDAATALTNSVGAEHSLARAAIQIQAGS